MNNTTNIGYVEAVYQCKHWTKKYPIAVIKTPASSGSLSIDGFFRCVEQITPENATVLQKGMKIQYDVRNNGQRSNFKVYQ